MAGFLARLFRTDPTADWPPANGRTPSFDPERGAFGPMRFGDAFEKGRALGKPSECKGNPETACTLYYDPGGYEVVFEQGKFVGVLFDMSTERVRMRKNAVPGVASVGGLPVSGRTTPEEVRAWFGEPSSEDGDGEFVEMEYERGKVVMSFEFEKATGLFSLDVYLND